MSRGSRRFPVLTALCLAALPSALPASAQSYFPGCPQWTHPVTFVNNCANSITVTETDGCFPTSSSQPPFNGGRCWPQQAPGGKLTLAANGGTQTAQILSCWSGNFGVSCTVRDRRRRQGGRPCNRGTLRAEQSAAAVSP